MKKLLIALFVFTLGFFLTACVDKALFEDVFSETLITYSSGDSISSVTSDITLMTESELVEEATLEWESKNPDAIRIDGDKGIVTRSSSDVEVTLILKVTIENTTRKKSIKLTVLALDENQVTVSFNANGGTGAPSSIVVAKNSKVTQPTQVPTREGYDFVGWFKDQNGTSAFNFATETITANIVLYAKWVEASDEVLAYHFDFGSNNLGYSYSKNTDATKNIKNLVTNTDFQVVVTRAAANNNHGTYKDNFLVMSSSSKKTDTDVAYVEFSFPQAISKMTFDAVYWSNYDADELTKLVLQVKNGDTWTDVFDIRAALGGSTTYKAITIAGLSGTEYRIYGEGNDPTGQGDNGARVLFDNMKIFTGGTTDPARRNLNLDLENLNITTRIREAGSILLPVVGNNGSTIAWAYKNTSSQDNSYVSLDNLTVSLPSEGMVNVIIVATLTNGDYTRTKEFTLIIGEGASYTDYYQSIDGLSGTALKAELKRIISKMTSISYTNTSYVLAGSDEDPSHPGNVLLVYNRGSVSGVWDEGKTWNKEHIWPQSKLGGASKSDLFNLRPSNPSINTQRQNDPYVDGSGSYGRKSGGWYPGDEDRGDIARAVFYMNTRWDLKIDGNIGNLQVFIKWHNEDPVDDFERNRNEVIYQNQGNRNPYVDHPELVDEIYGVYQAKQVKRYQPQIILYFDDRRRALAA
ncbi:MAG: hypothetical protein GX661_05515 [Acholeplasmataceae bacterium]|nr:hypothetical protein [Acholeplasmataceae bacterium]